MSRGSGQARRQERSAWWLLPLLPALALALNWPYLGAGFAADDVLLLNLLREGTAPSWWRGLWSVTDLECVKSLWWAGTLDEGGFWRPLPSLVIQGSLALFGETALPLHLLAILLHGASAVLIAVLAWRLAGHFRLGLLAGVAFLACEDHSMVVGWATTITDVLGTTFTAAALVAHASWLERRRPATLVASLLALVLALGSKESVVVVPLGLVGLSAVAHARAARAGAGPVGWLAALGRDLPAWLPALLVLAGYLVAYRALGFGVGSSQLYADPFSEPLTFLGHLVVQAPVLWLATLSPVPPSLAVFVPSAQPWLAGLGLVVAGLFLYALRPFRRDPVAWWALLFYLLALVPQTGAEGSERALYLPLVPGSVLLALLASQAGALARRGFAPAASTAEPTTATRLGGWWIVAGVLVPGLVLSAAFAFVYRASFELPGRQVKGLVALVEARRPAHVVVLNTSGPFLTFYLADEVSWRVGRRVDVRVLSSLNGVMTAERTGERAITLRTDRRGWLTNMFALVFRTSTRLEPNQSFRTDLFTAEIVELDMTAAPPDALAVRFDMTRALDDPRVLVVTWTGEAFAVIDLAAVPPGERRVLADTSDVWASLM